MVEQLQDPRIVLLVIFFIALIIQIGIWLFTYLRLALWKLPQEEVHVPVSVVICARNEEDNLKEFLPLVLNQNYPNYEVIVVNDCSWDNSYNVLKEYALQNPRLKVADIKEVEGREHGKKFALTIGIKAAHYETLLLTDADCRPSGPDWISTMMRGYQPGKEIVLGYGKYEKTGGLLNQFIRYDAFFIAVRYMALALNGKPYMGVGRNLSYQKHLFFGVKGFASHINLISGDDDLFINEVSNSSNTAVIAHPDAVTISVPKKTWWTWFLQKKRHHSTAKFYKTGHKTNLLTYDISLFVLYISIIAGLFANYQVLILISGWFLRAFIQIGILHAIARKLDEPDLGWKAPLLEIFHRLIIIPVYLISTLFVRQRKWI